MVHEPAVPDRPLRVLAVFALALAGLLGGVLALLAARPGLDLAVAAAFLDAPHHFLGDTPAGVAGRYALWSLPFVLLAGLVALGLAARLRLVAPRRGPSLRALLYLLLALLSGPWLAVHVTLKEVSHRPRPRVVRELGGTEPFRPWDRFDGSCRHDCAFPSGETALAAWTLAPASLAPPPWRAAALAAALLFTAGTGGWRMALGAHFLSDVVAAALVSLVLAAAWRPLAGAPAGSFDEGGGSR